MDEEKWNEIATVRTKFARETEFSNFLAVVAVAVIICFEVTFKMAL